MSGQGPQWWGMGRELMRTEPVFRATMERCAAAMAPHAGFSLLEELARNESDTRLGQTEFAQPAIFAMQIALAELWKSWGVEPSCIIGHSVGEVASACLAGIFTLEEGAEIIVVRARSMQECTQGDGGMLAVGLNETEANELIARHDPQVSIAAYNGPRSLTLSGLKASLEKIAAELEQAGVFARFVRVSHPFHHAMMQPAADAVEKRLAHLRPRTETVPFFCTVTGERCPGEDCVAAYWARGIRQPVRFVEAVNSMDAHGVDVWLELSAHPALAVSIQECLGAAGKTAHVVSSARRDREQESLVEAVCELHRIGVDLRFDAMTPSRRLLKLPAYPWNKARWWSESTESGHSRLSPGGRGLLDSRLLRSMPTWTCRLDDRHLAYLRDHKVDKHIVFPAAGFIEMALEAGCELFEGMPFAIEELEIRKPLIVPNNPEDVVMELTYDPVERTFNIQSRFEPSPNWSLHVVGSLRSERIESEFENSVWRDASAEMEVGSPESFYETMAGLGLPYGPEFRAMREFHCRGRRSAGMVSLSEAAAMRAGEYALHPVIMDAALHIFAASARSREGAERKIKLPVRFSRILFLRPPGPTARVSAEITVYNEELAEADIRLHDEEGRPCVLVEGFRAVALSSGRKAGGWSDLVYHLDWQRLPGAADKIDVASVPLNDLQRAATEACASVMALRDEEIFRCGLKEENDLAASFVAAGLRQMGVGKDASFTAESLGVVPAQRRVFARLMEALVKRGALAAGDGTWSPTNELAALADDAEPRLRRFLESHPEHYPQAILCATTGRSFARIMTGETDAVQVLFSGASSDLLEHLYSDGVISAPWLAAAGEVIARSAAVLPEGRGLRILEVGAGTGGLASYVLPRLERDLHSYTFTDVSTAFFHTAQQKLANFPEVEFRSYDLNADPVEQGLNAGSFDFIIGTNVLHAVADVRASLASLHRLLAPGGTLAFVDVATPRIWNELVFGLTGGWWSMTDTELRPDHPLLERKRWEEILHETGFAETASLPGLGGPEVGEPQFMVLARKAVVHSAPLETAVSGLDGTNWLVFVDRAGLGAGIGQQILAAGGRCTMVHKAASFAAGEDGYSIDPASESDWMKLAEVIASDFPGRVLYLWSLETARDGDVLDDVLALRNLSVFLGRFGAAASGARIDVVTRGAQPIGNRTPAVDVASGAILGIFRVVSNENPNIKVQGIDLPANQTDRDANILLRELLLEEPEREVALRDEARFGQRISRGLPSSPRLLAPEIPLRLESRDRGVLDSLLFAPFEMPVCESGQVLIRVKAAGLNFRDVLKAIGLYPAESEDARMFGDEVAGQVIAVGEGVSHVKPGDEVFGLAFFGLATHTLARAEGVLPLPQGVTPEQAATIPVVFMTAWHSLVNVARLRAGDKILVHAGAGGVGMAAVQIAHHLGAEVIASAGSPGKRALLKTLGVAHVVDSRRGDFAEEVKRLTGGRGVDVVLNALAAEAIPMGLSCLAEFGRFVEIGKRDIYQNSKLPMWHLRKNASFHVVAMDAVFAGDAALTRELMAEITGLVAAGKLGPLLHRSFPANRVDAAFRLMAGGRHTGKVILNFAEPFVPREGELPSRPFAVDPEATYLVTGGFGGFGKSLARWLVEKGARHLVLTSRRGAAAEGAAELVAELGTQGAEVLAVTADIGDAGDVGRIFKEIAATGRPLKGVFHLAMVIDDAPLSDLTGERIASVLGPKARGAWLLHEATASFGLDAFVMFSSATSVFGNPVQGNYSAANGFLDSLAHHRRALGLPALAVNWGALGGEGYVARNEKVAEYLARIGTEMLEPREVFEVLENLLGTRAAQVAGMRVDWSKWRQGSKGAQDNRLFERVLSGTTEADESGGKVGDWRKRIDDANPVERDGVIVQALQEVVGSVLRVKPDSLRPEQPLTDLGLDSLMGVEIENMIENSIGVTLPPTSLLRARTIGQIATLLDEYLGGGGNKAPAAPAPVQEAAVTVDEIDFDEIDTAALDEIVAETPAEVADRQAAPGTQA